MSPSNEPSVLDISPTNGTVKVFEFLNESGITGSYADEMGCTLVTAEEVAAVSNFPVDKIGPEGAIKIPYPGVRAHDGSTYCRYRLLAKDAKPKYLGLAGHFPEIYIPVRYAQNAHKDDLYITEGEKKAALLDSLGLRAVGISGVSAWADAGHRAAQNIEGEGLTEDTLPHKVILREAVAAKRVIIVVDSDLAFNARAAHGINILKQALQKYLDNRSIVLMDDPSFNPVTGARNIWVDIAILPPELDVQCEDGKITSIKIGPKLGVDDYFLRLRAKHEQQSGQDTAAIKASAQIKQNVLSLALANMGRVESKLALVVAAENQGNLAHTAGTFRCYHPATGIWSDAEANEELGTVPAAGGKYATASSVLASIRHTVLWPIITVDDKNLPAPIATWKKGIEKDIKDLKAIENDLGTTRTQVAILKQVSRRVVIPNKRWDNHPDLFVVRNGVINLRTGELLPHSASRLLTIASPATYNPIADCPQWKEFLDQVLPDPETQEYLQGIAGYSLTGHTNVQKIWFFRGPGGNGKGLYTNVLRDVIHGTYSVVADKNIILKSRNGGETHPTNVAALMGKRWATFSELDEHSHIDCASLKSLTGDDMKTARKMRQDFVDFRPQATYTIDTNEVPYLSDTGPSMKRRLVLIDWNFKAGDNPDEGYKDRLCTEASGILNWALEGARKYYAGILHSSQTPAAVLASTAKLWGSLDITQQWIDAECIKDPGAETNAKGLFTAHRKWREASLNPPVSANMFGRKMKQAGFNARESHGQKLFQGIRLRNASEMAVLSYDNADEADILEEPAPKKPNGSETPITKKRRMIQ